MKKIKFLFLFLSIVGISFSQILEPVKWTFEKENLGNNEYNIVFKANIDDHWSIYSQFIDEGGPIPTSFNYEKKNGVEVIGKVVESAKKTKEGFDKMFEMNVKKFQYSATFKQKVKVTGNASIKGYLEFMTCDDEQCLPPQTIDFNFDFSPEVKNIEKQKQETKEIEKQADNVEEETKSILTDSKIVVKSAQEEEKQETTTETQQDFLEPVKWLLEVTKTSETTALITFTAKIDEHWGVYAQEVGEGPVPTSFVFEGDIKNYKLKDGFLKEESEHVFEGYDKMFDSNIKKFKKEVSFSKEIEILESKGKIQGYLEFMTCDEEQCLPPQGIDFEINLSTLETKIGDEIKSTNTNNETKENKPFIISSIDLDNPISECGEITEEEDVQKKGFWLVFLMGLGGGFLALLTPCVFPMIPLTVSFFTKGSQGKKGLVNAFLYGFFIILVYVGLSLPFHVLEGLSPNILNDISTSVWLNIVFFAVFVFFAFSFFGFYEIELPSSFADKSSKAEGAGGILGIFFMAITLAIVSFSCTGPILGVLMGSLATSGSAGAMNLTAGMFGFGVAFALPFTLFAAFPKLLNSLPSSGGWMNTVKVVLGFIEIALALKFFSNADLVSHWGVLKYEAFIGLWIIVFIGLSLYFFGKIKFPHDSPIEKLSKTRIVLGTLVMAFVIYLFTGFMFDEKTKTYNSLDLLSGFPPPEGYSWMYPIDCPQNFQCFHDYDEALAYAKEVGKPLMLDFTGHACVNCRKVEKNIWSQPQVHKLIDENYVIVSLYVDDKTMLPESEQIEVEYNGKTNKLRTVGNKWAYMESANFGQVSQPWYVLLSTDEELLTNPIGYSKGDVNVHEDFLNCGLEAFESLK